MNATIDEVRWLSDILLLHTKYNRSNLDAGSPLLPDGGGLIALFILHFSGTIVNGFLLTAMLMERGRRKLKVKVLLLMLTMVHFLWSVLWLGVSICLSLLPSDSSSIEFLHFDQEDQEMRQILWELVGRQLVDNSISMISLYFLAICFERYLNLLEDYSPYADSACVRFSVAVLPAVVAFSLFDHRPISLLISIENAVVCRLCLLLIPCLLSFVFSVISSIRPAPNYEAFSSLSGQLPILLLLFSIADITIRTAFFFQLLELNFDFVIVTGNESNDRLLTSFFDAWQWMARWMLHCWAIAFPFCLIFCVKLYRNMTLSLCSRMYAFICCSRKKKVDYNRETLRSIIGGRHAVSSIH